MCSVLASFGNSPTIYSKAMATKKSRILKSLRSGNGAGHIKSDSKGKTVWEWDTEGEEPEETSVLIGRLHNDDLALVEDAPGPEDETDPEDKAAPKDEAGPEDEADSEKPILKKTDEGGGFDPYGQD